MRMAAGSFPCAHKAGASGCTADDDRTGWLRTVRWGAGYAVVLPTGCTRPARGLHTGRLDFLGMRGQQDGPGDRRASGIRGARALRAGLPERTRPC
jgi:hypothetical protein